MCTQGCRAFIWGGTGVQELSHEHCSCVCDDGSWSDLNILDSASCVPRKAHLVFGWFGLVLSTTCFCHAAYHRHRQVCTAVKIQRVDPEKKSTVDFGSRLGLTKTQALKKLD